MEIVTYGRVPYPGRWLGPSVTRWAPCLPEMAAMTDTPRLGAWGCPHPHQNGVPAGGTETHACDSGDRGSAPFLNMALGNRAVSPSFSRGQ